MDAFERESYEFEVSDRKFRIEEFTGLERRRYARKLLELHERSKSVALAEIERCGGDTQQIDFARLSDEVLSGEEEFVAWLLNLATSDEVSSEWVAENFPVSMQTRLFAKVDELNRMADHVGNVFGRLGSVQAALTLSKNGSSSLTK
jgi:hypothetical protein